ncbi:MAG TPA: nucleotide exchange factor GrpE [Gemmatimonadaceae bacterium]|nr:nucleotide exchange factor GrpE [Gemmatimonadaceae bacterium]
MAFSNDQTKGAGGTADDASREQDVNGSADAADPELHPSASDAQGAGSAAQGAAPAGAQPDEHRERYLRLAAEYDNYRKRTARERQEAGARAQAELVRHLIDALDDISRFAHLDPGTTDTATVVQGVDMVERKLLKSLGAAGLQVVNPVDQAFDPALHEAVATEPALSSEDDHMVARVYQPGYLFNGQLLRPARVVVKQWS